LKDPAVIDLAMWKNPKKSGAVLGGATALYVLFELSTYTLIEMMSTAALVFILASSLWSFVAVHLGRDGMPLPPFVKEGISDEAARKLVIDKALPELNKALGGALPPLSSWMGSLPSFPSSSALSWGHFGP